MATNQSTKDLVEIADIRDSIVLLKNGSLRAVLEATAVNFELRSRPVQILSVQFGAAAFYDMGDTGIDMSNIHLRHGVGGGLRVAFPQIQRSVFRLDVGVPLDPNDRYANASVIARFEQAFPVPALASPGLTQ